MKKGFLAGVFDLFHIGHLNIIKRARENCDYLLIGINSDELVKEYKKKTPIIPQQERVEILKAIKYVDEVVVLNNRDKIEAYKKYKFDILFAGDDWKGSEHYDYMEKELEKYGVKIIYFPYTKGTSSTLLTCVLNDALKK